MSISSSVTSSIFAGLSRICIWIELALEVWEKELELMLEIWDEALDLGLSEEEEELEIAQEILEEELDLGLSEEEEELELVQEILEEEWDLGLSEEEMVHVLADETLELSLAQAMRRRERVKPDMEAALEEKEWAKEMKATTCTVCLEEFVEGERVAMMPCEHCFHKECIVPWLTQESNTCPLCRCIV